ncbi:hypothetical protein PR048_020462 [Dryococelus australis]|uniref:Uncharacterized protein n=1 Tax=Dryococelus australis TaxID=614101 RepID=A0ABQ9H6C2_9NEOP|nr:hypothetical protein PR048_020462 [Dryococelus australis]
MYLKPTTTCYLFQEDTAVTEVVLQVENEESTVVSVNDEPGLANSIQNIRPRQQSGREDKDIGNYKKSKLSLEEERSEEADKILKSSVMRDDYSVYGEHVENELRK